MSNYKILHHLFISIASMSGSSVEYAWKSSHTDYRKVWAIRTKLPMHVVETAAKHGLCGADIVQVIETGEYIVYWPNVKYNI